MSFDFCIYYESSYHMTTLLREERSTFRIRFSQINQIGRSKISVSWWSSCKA